MAAIVDLALEEEKKAFKEYLLTKNVSDKSANVAISKAFGIWKLKDRETFEALMKSDNFEKDAKALLVEIYNGNEKKAAAYYSELKRYFVYYREKNGLPVPEGIQNAKPGRKPKDGSKTKAAAKKTAKKAAAKKTSKKETKAAAGKKRGRKPAAEKAEAAKKTATKKAPGRKPAATKKTPGRKVAAAKKTPGRKPATKVVAKTGSARNTTASNAALVKAINELNKTLAPIAKLASKLK